MQYTDPALLLRTFILLSGCVMRVLGGWRVMPGLHSPVIRVSLSLGNLQLCGIIITIITRFQSRD